MANHFNLTLDTLGPTGAIRRPDKTGEVDGYLNKNGNLKIEYYGNPVYMKVWFDNKAEGLKSDAATIDWEPVSTSYTTKFVIEGAGYYYHVYFVDDVANESVVYNTEVISFDTTAPTISKVTVSDPYSGNTAIVSAKTGIKYKIEWTDSAPAAAIKAIISGDDISTFTQDISAGSTTLEGTFDFIAGVADGTKTINVKLIDQAGNESNIASCSIILDTNLDAPILVLKNSAGDVLPEYINFRDIKINLSCSDDNIVGYKIWEGNNEPQEFTAVEGKEFNVTIDWVLAAGDSEKTIHGKVIDAAGNTQEAEPKSVKLDQTKPVVSISTNKNIISNINTFNKAILTLSGTDAYSGISYYTLKCGETEISSGSTETIPSTFELTSANSMVEGSNTITLEVTDKAGNVNSASVNIILDTTAPSNVKIGTLNEWYNADFNITVTHTDENGVGYIYAWVSTLATDKNVPAGLEAISAGSGSTDIASNNIGGNKIQSDSNYMHVKVIDVVGNATYDHAKFGFDNVKPITPRVSFNNSAYKSTAATIDITYDDATSGVVSMQVIGDITNGTSLDTWEAISGTRSVTLTSGDGIKSVKVRVKDAAGNISEYSSLATTELDTTSPTASLQLLNADGVTAKPLVSPIRSFALKIIIDDGENEQDNQCKYKIYGDFNRTAEPGDLVGIKESDAPWENYTGGSSGIIINGLYATDYDGVKNITIKVEDNAGNIIVNPVSISFTYDTTPPIVTISDLDYNRISKVHVLRRSAATIEVAGKYADEVNFEFTSDSTYQAYKVCAYLGEEEALAGSPATDAPIGTVNGSINMSGTGLNQKSTVMCKIKGADFEAALGAVGEVDGAHIVVVYVQDLGGTWSALAQFTS